MEDPFAHNESPRCEECPATLLDAYLRSASGQLIQQTFDLEFALQAGVTIRLEDIAYSEFLMLRLLSQERNRLLKETMPGGQPMGRPSRIG